MSTPHEIARDVLEKHLPTTFSNSDEVCQAAVDLKHRLVEQLERIRMPGNALDMLVAQFGVSSIAEMTGRKWRFVTHADGTTRRETRAENGMSQDQVNLAEKAAFLNGKKPVAVISDAASSGISLHADPRFKNTKKRLHITLELAWSADKMLQQFGRTHRSNQLQAPHYQILTTDVGGEQRFASSVARRLETLGAITRGDRRGGHGMAADLVQVRLATLAPTPPLPHPYTTPTPPLRLTLTPYPYPTPTPALTLPLPLTLTLPPCSSTWTRTSAVRRSLSCSMLWLRRLSAPCSGIAPCGCFSATARACPHYWGSVWWGWRSAPPQISRSRRRRNAYLKGCRSARPRPNP